MIIIVALFFKELGALCFDESWAAARGWSVTALDFLLTGLVAMVTVLAIQSVGMVLAIALLIIPASTALLWSRRLVVVVVVSAACGGSAPGWGPWSVPSIPRMPTGPVIVLVCAVLFFLSLGWTNRRAAAMAVASHVVPPR